jgi:hypothetical protein
MSDMAKDLEGYYLTQRSRIADSPQYAKPVVITEYGWAKRGHKTTWFETKIIPLSDLEKTNDPTSRRI